jgi:hypothetical protein
MISMPASGPYLLRRTWHAQGTATKQSRAQETQATEIEACRTGIALRGKPGQTERARAG